jgi:hypothetical protein
VRRGAQGLGARRECGTSLKNSKSAIKLLQVALASAPTAKPEFSRLNTHNGATHRSKCPARTAAPVAGAGHCTGCIWATAGPLHATACRKPGGAHTAVDMVVVLLVVVLLVVVLLVWW